MSNRAGLYNHLGTDVEQSSGHSKVQNYSWCQKVVRLAGLQYRSIRSETIRRNWIARGGHPYFAQKRGSVWPLEICFGVGKPQFLIIFLMFLGISHVLTVGFPTKNHPSTGRSLPGSPLRAPRAAPGGGAGHLQAAAPAADRRQASGVHLCDAVCGDGDVMGIWR